MEDGELPSSASGMLDSMNRSEKIRRLQRQVLLFGIGVSVAVFIAIPTLFFVTTYKYERESIQAEADLLVQKISEIAFTMPKTWKFSQQTVRALSYMHDGHDHSFEVHDLHVLFDVDGQEIARLGDEIPLPWLTTTAEITDTGSVVGRLVIWRSLEPIIVSTVWVAMIGLLLAGAVFVILRALPLRSLSIALQELDHTQTTLRGRVTDLETAKQELERQRGKLAEQAKELTDSRDTAQQNSRVKSDFLATMSHEIRTPMNAVLGMSELLMGTELDDRQHSYALAVHNSGSDLLRVINDILDFSKLESGKFEFEDKSFSPKDVVSGVTQLLDVESSKRGTTLQAIFEPDVPGCVSGDAVRLRQVLVNLIGNAIKFTESGTINVAVQRMEDSEGHLRFSVTDTGIGIPEDIQANLFDKFTQADSSTTRRFGGTGLGLAICKLLVQGLGGEIGVKSTFGKGSVFWFTARFGHGPDCDSEEAVPAPALVVARPVDNDGEQNGKAGALKILVVEDNPTNQLLVTATLDQFGHTWHMANNGVEAVEAAGSEVYDLILMDINMPVMDGVTATAAIREFDGTKSEVPIIALTANAIKGDRERFLASGFDDYMSKPMDRKLLASILDKWSRNGGAAASESLLESAQENTEPPILDETVINDWRSFLGPEKFDELATTQKDVAKETRSELREARADGAFDRIGELAHSLKGSSGSIGLARVHRLSRDLEQACKNGNEEQALELLTALEPAIDEAIAALEAGYGRELVS